MASKYDHWLAGDFDSDREREDAIAEAVEERTDELIDKWMADPVKVASALDELSGTSDRNVDGNTHFSASLAAAFVLSGKHWQDYADDLYHSLKGYFKRDASTEAAHQIHMEADPRD